MEETERSPGAEEEQQRKQAMADELTGQYEEEPRSSISQTSAPGEEGATAPAVGAIESEHERKGTPGGPGIYREEAEES